MPRLPVKILPADVSQHKEICKIAKQSRYTRDYSNMIFSGEDCYKAGRIKIAKRGGALVGFACFRYRKRDGITVLYFMGVDQKHQQQGIGSLLLKDLWAVSIGSIELKVMKDNLAVEFWKKWGFSTIGEAFDGKAWVMRAQKEPPVVEAGGVGDSF